MSATSPSPRKLIIATRESALALWKAEHVRNHLHAHYPLCELTLLGLTTQGDRIIDQPLADIGGKGLFIKELEQAMADGRADLAVHSLKDVPMDMPSGFVLAAIMKRDDPRDAGVSKRDPARPRGSNPISSAGRSPGAQHSRNLEPATRGPVARALSGARRQAASR